MANRTNQSKQFRDNKGRFARCSSEEQRKTASEGGKKRWENERRQRAFADICRAIDDMPMKSPSFADGLRSLGIPEDTIETLDQKVAAAFALKRRMLQGDPKAIELWLKLTGEYVENKNINISGAPLSDGVVSFTVSDE